MAPGLQMLQGELPDGLQHAEARFAVRLHILEDQPAIDEIGEVVEHAVWVHSERMLPGLPRSGRCDQGFRRLEGEAAGKDREGLEEPLLVGRQEVVAPGDRVAQRALPVGEIAGAAREDIEPAVEPEQEGGGRKDAGAGGGQLDRERQTIKPEADLFHRRQVGPGDGEIGPDRLGPLGEERDSVRDVRRET